MTLADVVIAIVWAGVLAYAVFGGADFGSGAWDLLAGRSRAGAKIRKRIDRSIGPVWEANHVWLIFVLVYLWTAFPEVFAAIVTATFIPLIGVAVGIIFRGGAFVFRKSSSTFESARFFGALFAVSSLVTPFFLGAVAGAVASGRVPLDGDVDPWAVWLTPTSFLGGALAVGTCMWQAAVFLAADAKRDGEVELAAYFARRSQITAVVLGAIALSGIVVIETDAPTLADGLETWGAPLVALSGLGGLAAMFLLRRGDHELARIPAVVAVVSVMLGWGVGQYPWMLVDEVEITDAAAPSATLWALVLAFGLAGLLVVPSLVWLLRLTAVGALSTDETRDDSSLALHARLSATATATATAESD